MHPADEPGEEEKVNEESDDIESFLRQRERLALGETTQEKVTCSQETSIIVDFESQVASVFHPINISLSFQVHISGLVSHQKRLFPSRQRGLHIEEEPFARGIRDWREGEGLIGIGSSDDTGHIF
jgi:hypothetical protein